ncbi:MAG: AbrB/MazE/SpoVT family DNA-binding domain-containing protein [Lachnospiraceae bacterium]|nr:AbrB/MazE/SpoVT family DNA-binding domain-containing protein [Lachnospiraceae bacterium]
MLVELRQKSQITIPKEIIVKLGLSEGDKLDIFEKDGTICMMPVVVYPKKYLDELREEIDETKAKIASGEQPVFDNVDALFAKLETD